MGERTEGDSPNTSSQTDQADSPVQAEAGREVAEALARVQEAVIDVKAQTYSFEAANVRHEHEWRVWQNVKLPTGKMLMPGVVSHATNLVEHPQLVADRILRYAAIAGRENVIAGTDCGLGGRVHADLAWAKLHALVEGARLASKSLWP